MSDLISRQAAIDALNEVSEHYTEKGREWHPHVNFMIYAIKEMPSAQPEQRWIPASERLPENHKDVLVAGIEMLNNSIVYAVKQLDIDTWRPADYAPSVWWEAWMPIEPWRGEEG